MTHTICIAPNRRAMNGARIGRLEGGVCVSTPDLSDAEIEACGLTGLVLLGTPDANRMYPVADGGYGPMPDAIMVWLRRELARTPLPQLPPSPR